MKALLSYPKAAQIIWKERVRRHSPLWFSYLNISPSQCWLPSEFCFWKASPSSMDKSCHPWQGLKAVPCSWEQIQKPFPKSSEGTYLKDKSLECEETGLFKKQTHWSLCDLQYEGSPPGNRFSLPGVPVSRTPVSGRCTRRRTAQNTAPSVREPMELKNSETNVANSVEPSLNSNLTNLLKQEKPREIKNPTWMTVSNSPICDPRPHTNLLHKATGSQEGLSTPSLPHPSQW